VVHREIQEISKLLHTCTEYLVWKRKLKDYLGKSTEASLDWQAGAECVARYANAERWEWTHVSRPHFWRWPMEYQKAIRDGVIPWLKVPYLDGTCLNERNVTRASEKR